jgi:hypothetical protein
MSLSVSAVQGPPSSSPVTSSSPSSISVIDDSDGIEHILESVESAHEDGPESAFAAFFSLVYPWLLLCSDSLEL